MAGHDPIEPTAQCLNIPILCITFGDPVELVTIKPVSIVIPAQFFKLILSLALQILIARLLLPDGRGVYGICIATASALLVVSYFGNEFGIRYLLVRKRITSSQAFRYLLSTAALAFAASLLLTWVVTHFDFWLAERVTWVQLVLASGLAFSQLVTTQINVFITIEGKYLGASILAIAEEALKVTAIAALLVAFSSVEVALGAAIIANVIITTFSVVRYGFHRKDFTRLRIRDLAFIYRYGSRSIWLNLSNLSNAHLGTLVLSGLMSNERVGIYNLAFALIAKIQVFPDALNRVLVPASMASKDGASRYRMVQISVTGLLAFSLLIAPVLGLFSPQIMVLLFGAEYIEAGPIAFVLFVGFLFKLIGKPLEAHFNEIVGKPTILAGIQIFSMALMALLTYFGASHFSLLGAAIGSAIAFGFGAMALFYIHAKSTGRNFLSPIAIPALIERIRCLVYP